MIPTKLSYLLAGLIPDARIRIYDDAAHAFLFQCPQQVAADVGDSLEGQAEALEGRRVDVAAGALP